MQTTQRQRKAPVHGRRAKTEDTKLRQELVAILDKFFQETPYSVVFDKGVDSRLSMMVTYTDFFSKALIGRMLSDAIPKDVHVVLKREYSDKAVAKVLADEYRRNRVAVVDCYNGELRPQTIQDFVNSALEKHEIL